ncbi:MAG: glycosyltransferase family 4 protein [Chloroflexota bacterium]
MRLLMLNNEYPPIGGGTATANYYVVREMARRGLSVDLVTSTPDNAQFQVEQLSPQARVFRVPIDNNNPHYQSERELIKYIIRAFGFIRTLYRGDGPKYDLCHAWSGLPAGALALLLLWKRRLPYIVGLRGSDVPGYDVRYKYLYPVLKPPLWMIWGGASGLTANSYELRNLALEFRPNDDIEVIPNGVDLQRFSITDLENRPSDVPLTVLCVARLVERKGIGDLLNAMQRIREHHPQARLLLAGRGDKEAQFRRQASDMGLEDVVDFRGAVPHHDMPAVYNEADVFVLPSLNEGMSNAVLEAMASGLPVVTTYTGGTTELVRGNGMIIPKQSPDAIAKSVNELLADRALRAQLGKRSRGIAETLVWEKVTENYLNYYDRTLAAIGSTERVNLRPDTSS